MILLMRDFISAILLLLAISEQGLAQKKSTSVPFPDRFEIGQYTYFDMGPAIYEEIFVVRATDHGSSIERVTLSPSRYSCSNSAQLEVATANTPETIEVLLQHRNPCAIPDKELHKKAKKCKHCLVFSYATSTMQAQCGTQTRLIPAFIYEEYWFDKSAKIPHLASLLLDTTERLDKAVGPGVMEKPTFETENDESKPNTNLGTQTIEDLKIGKYDPLFSSVTYKPSGLYRASKNPPAPPNITIESNPYIKHEQGSTLVYPAIARLAHVEGKVVMEFDVASEGETTNIKTISGEPMLVNAALHAVSEWKYPKDAMGQHITASIEFKTNCPR